MLTGALLSLLMLQAGGTALPVLPVLPSASAVPGRPLPEELAAQCRAQASRDPAAAILTASEWEAQTTGPDRSLARQCLGHAYVSLTRWQAAEQAFLAARQDRPASDNAMRGRLGAMAGNAALADGRPGAALAHFDQAIADAGQVMNPQLTGEIQADKSRALVALDRAEDARATLGQARALAPQQASAWLLSATLARRMGDLAAAQSFIETAAALAATDPAVGLEGGVIAMLAGREDAARKSWQSVVATAPDTAEAQTARDYLAQIAPAEIQPAQIQPAQIQPAQPRQEQTQEESPPS